MAEFDLRNFEAVAFDFDGLLADSVGTHTVARREAYEQKAGVLDDARYSAIPDEIHEMAHLYGSHPDEINAWIMSQVGIIDNPHAVDHPAVKDLCALKNEIYHKAIQKGLDEQPGAVQFVRRVMACRPGRLAIVTTATSSEVMPYLRRYKLDRYFPAKRLIARNTDGVDQLKPAPDAYQVAIKNLGASAPEKMLVLEDSEQGIEAANQAGATVLALATTRSFDRLSELEGLQRPDVVAHDFDHASQLVGLDA
jgi:HAD superfamily hydrolase (TIGR01509 family)